MQQSSPANSLTLEPTGRLWTLFHYKGEIHLFTVTDFWEFKGNDHKISASPIQHRERAVKSLLTYMDKSFYTLKHFV